MDESREMEGSAVHVWAGEYSGNEDAGVSKVEFTIGELSREFGVTLRALRFYENKGLITPQRDGLNRLYSQGDRTRLALILKGKKLGFTLGEIRQ
ncbi:MAG: MerR family transcriptional regulator, partial [Alphaproteobacteria bacterium]|nr:MerR family transcriptional regulator [Alphaproteobacteria bacterium]